MDARSQQTEENAWEKITVFGFFFAFEIKDVSVKWDLDSSTELITVTAFSRVVKLQRARPARGHFTGGITWRRGTSGRGLLKAKRSLSLKQ